MIQISADQLDAMSSELERAYRRELADDLKRQYPRQVAALGDEPLHRIVAQALAKARDAGVTSSGALYRYVCLAVLIHPEFDATPEVRALLDAPGMDADYKVHLLSDILIAQLGGQ